jgi:aldehyde oxidoreductase
MRKKPEKNVRFAINGKWIEKEVRPDLTLLRFLRDELRLTGTKDGCGKGQCGTCTVLIDGKAARSCTQKVSGLDGKKVETIEGLGIDGSLHPIQQAFLSAGAVQCGFCTPGMILASKALLEKHPSPSEGEMREGLKHNLCRCTGYVKIIEAVKIASELMRQQQASKSEPLSALPSFSCIGHSFPDIDGPLKVKGELKFADDISIEGVGYGAILWSQHPHAALLSIDTSRAEEMKGVRAVLTARDIPGRNGHGLLRPDQPVLADKKVRYMGDPVALVIADSYAIAKEASEKISVEYRELKGVFSPQEALNPDASLIHDQGNTMRKIRHTVGDIEKAFSQADCIVEGRYSTPFIEHAYLECESALATLTEDGKIHLWTGTQMPFEFRTQIAACLKLPEESVRIISTPLGGGFGGKISITVQALAALGALRTGRPVKITLTREESLRFSPKKHASFLHYRTGFSKEGKIIVNQASILLDGGPYTEASPIVLDQAAIFSCGPYEIPHVAIEGTCTYTNNANGGAMRGFGINQVAFAMEEQLDIAARKLKIDPLELRLINALEPGKRTITGEVLHASVPMKETIRTVRRALASLPAFVSANKIGVGVAAAFKNVGVGKGNVDNAGAILELTDEGTIRLNVSTVDMGQGSRTVMAQIAAHELGISQANFELITGDTALVLKATGVAGERATYCAGNAVIGAARAFKKVLLEEVAKTYSRPVETLHFGEDGLRADGTASDTILRFKEIGQRLASQGRKVKVAYNYNAPKTFPISHDGIPESGTAMARYAPSGVLTSDQEYRNYPAYTYITNVVIVEVDESTGEVNVKKVIAAVDVGKAINLQKIEGQIEGSILMGMGYALSEQFEVSSGIPKTDLKKCGIPTIDQTPEIITLIIEDEDPGGPYGAKGISEVATVPVTPAIINAIYDAVGVRICDLPATKDKILKALRSSE